MTYDNSPGSPDGPPVEERPTVAQRLGFATGIAIVSIALTFMVTGMVWATAWMITNFPS